VIEVFLNKDEKDVEVFFSIDCFDGMTTATKQSKEVLVLLSSEDVISGATEQILVQELLAQGFIAPSMVGELARKAIDEVMKEFGRSL